MKSTRHKRLAIAPFIFKDAQARKTAKYSPGLELLFKFNPHARGNRWPLQTQAFGRLHPCSSVPLDHDDFASS